MKHRPNAQLPMLFAICATALLLQACTPKPYIPIRYTPPLPASEPLLTVFLQFMDDRTDPVVLRPNAKDKFSYFSGHYCLILAGDHKSEINLGAKNLSELFQVAIAHRLESAGLRMSQEEKSADAAIGFTLKDFHLDYSEGSWTAELAYKAELTTGKGFTAIRSVNASGERKRIFGTRDAEILLEEIFTEAVNSLEVKALTHEVGLLP